MCRYHCRNQANAHLRPELCCAIFHFHKYMTHVLAPGMKIVIEINRTEYSIPARGAHQEIGKRPLRGYQKHDEHNG